MIWITLLYFYDLLHYVLNTGKWELRLVNNLLYELNNNQFISKLSLKVKYNIVGITDS